MNSLTNSLRLLELTSLKVLLEISRAVQFSSFVMKKWVWKLHVKHYCIQDKLKSLLCQVHESCEPRQG